MSLSTEGESVDDIIESIMGFVGFMLGVTIITPAASRIMAS